MVGAIPTPFVATTGISPIVSSRAFDASASTASPNRVFQAGGRSSRNEERAGGACNYRHRQDSISVPDVALVRFSAVLFRLGVHVRFLSDGVDLSLARRRYSRQPPFVGNMGTIPLFPAIFPASAVSRRQISTRHARCGISLFWAR